MDYCDIGTFKGQMELKELFRAKTWSQRQLSGMELTRTRCNRWCKLRQEILEITLGRNNFYEVTHDLSSQSYSWSIRALDMLYRPILEI